MGISRNQRIKHVVLFTAFILIIVAIVPLMIGLGASGFDSQEILTQYMFYVGPAGLAMFIILCFFVAELITFQGDAKYGDGLGFAPPRDSFIKSRILNNPVSLFLLSGILFSILGLIAVYTKQTAFTGFNFLSQQFTVLSGLSFSSALIPAAENLGAAAILAASIYSLRYFARKYRWSKGTLITSSLLFGFVVVGVYGLINHLLRYSNSDTALITVFFFWAVGGLISVMTGSFIPFWVMHIANNLFFDLREHFTNDIITVYTVTAIIIFIILFSFIFLRKGMKKNAT